MTSTIMERLARPPDNAVGIAFGGAPKDSQLERDAVLARQLQA